MEKQFDNINVLVPKEFKSYNARRHDLHPKVNVSFSYRSTEDAEIFFIGSSEIHHSNILWSSELYRFLQEYVNEYVKNLFEVETYETSFA